MDAGDFGRHVTKSKGLLFPVIGQSGQIPVLLETILINLDEILLDHSVCCSLNFANINIANVFSKHSAYIPCLKSYACWLCK